MPSPNSICNRDDPHLLLKAMPRPERTRRIKELLAKGLGDGSIAVRLNNQGIECSRGDVFHVRTGRFQVEDRGIDEAAMSF